MSKAIAFLGAAVAMAGSACISVADDPPSAEHLGRASVEYRTKSCASGEVRFHVVNEVGPQQSEIMYEILYDKVRERQIRRTKLTGQPEWTDPVVQIISPKIVIQDGAPNTAVQVTPSAGYKAPKEDLTLLDPRPLGMVPGGADFLHRAQIDIFHNRNPGIKQSVVRDSSEGVLLWRVDTGDPAQSGGTRIWYSPSQGYGVVRMEIHATSGGIKAVDITEATLRQYARGDIWYPSKVVATRMIDGKARSRQVVHVLSASFNGSLGDAAFGLEGMGLKPGRDIVDGSGGVPRALVWDGTKSVEPTSIPRDSTRPGGTPPSPVRRWLPVIAAAALVLLAIGVVLYRRSLRVKPGPPLP